MTKLEAVNSNGREWDRDPTGGLPLVIALNCLDDCRFEEETLRGIALVQHVELSRIADGRIESAMAVLLHSLAYLPRAAQRRLQPWQLILCLGSSDKAVDSALATDLGLQVLHVDTARAEEVADTVMALLLGLIRHTHLLSKQGFSSSGWLGSLQPLCRGMRRCHGLVLGIIGRSASACALATRSLAFKIRVLYYDCEEVNKGKAVRGRRSFPPAAKQMDTLNDLLSASDLVSLHCAVTNETLQILNLETLQHIKPGAFIVNTSSSHLLDDCALKQLLIDGTVAGCALDGAEGPQWMEAWPASGISQILLPLCCHSPIAATDLQVGPSGGPRLTSKKGKGRRLGHYALESLVFLLSKGEESSVERLGLQISADRGRKRGQFSLTSFPASVDFCQGPHVVCRRSIQVRTNLYKLQKRG